jgi:hypothetical protein
MESLAWLRARSDRAQRKLGYVGEAVAINARYARCKTAWDAHLLQSRQFVIDAIAHCAAEHTAPHTALILGAGNCLDVPLKELSSGFKNVLLVDAVQLASTNRRVQKFKNIDYIVHDISEINQQLMASNDLNSLQMLSNKMPCRFVDNENISLVVSLNLLSQLPLLPMRYLRAHHPFSDAEINAIGLNLMRVHCRYLQQFSASKVLIYDAEQWQLDLEGKQHEHLSLASWLRSEQLIPPAQLESSWQWTVAPAGEQKLLSTQHQVQALLFAR